MGRNAHGDALQGGLARAWASEEVYAAVSPKGKVVEEKEKKQKKKRREAARVKRAMSNRARLVGVKERRRRRRRNDLKAFERSAGGHGRCG